MPAPTMPPAISDYVTIRRSVFDAGTKQTTWQNVYTDVPAFIHDVSHQLIAGGMAPEYNAKILVDGSVDLRDGDQLLGYNPLGRAVAPIVQVNKVATHPVPGMPRAVAGTGIRTAFLKILEQGG